MAENLFGQKKVLFLLLLLFLGGGYWREPLKFEILHDTQARVLSLSLSLSLFLSLSLSLCAHCALSDKWVIKCHATPVSVLTKKKG